MEWTFLSNYAHVLMCLQQDPHQRLRDIAKQVGITERGVQQIVHELHEAGYISIEKEGRPNRYKVHAKKRLRHPMEPTIAVGKLLEFLETE